MLVFVTAPTLWRPRRLVPSGRKVPRRKNSPLMQPLQNHRGTYSPQQRILLLDTWQRSGLPAKDFADLVGISKQTLYKWKQLFTKYGPEGFLEQPRQRKKGSRLPEVTKRAILMLKKAHPEWGCERIGDALARGPALSAISLTITIFSARTRGSAVWFRPIVSSAPPTKRGSP